MSSPADERVLLLMPNQRDTERTSQLLKEAGIGAASCRDLRELIEGIGQGAAALLVTEEVVATAPLALQVSLREQPPWSMVYVILVAREGSRDRLQYEALGGYGNVLIVERPVRTRSLVSAVRSALRARNQQYAVRDAILERDRQTAEVHAQDEKLRFALSAGSLGSWELDLRTGAMICSDICKANFGRHPDAPFSYEDLKLAIHPEDRERTELAVDTSLKDGGKYDVEYRAVWPDGQVHWILVRGRARYGPHGEPTGMLGVSLDITERKQLQAELASQAAQLREADRKKDEFLATLAHELRNPLAPIRSGLSLLEGGAMPDASMATVAIMQRQVTHMVRLIDDLLDVSRITRGKLELKRQRVSVASVLASAIEASQPNLERGNHTLHTEINAAGVIIEVDDTRIAQAVSNLLNNASKFTPAGGHITLTAHPDGEEVLISVRDDGIGILPEHLQRVFEMFGQLDPAMDSSQAGLGIGLALVRKLVEMHGGTVRAESAGAGMGSSFDIRLPRAPNEEVSEQPPVLASRRQNSSRARLGSRRQRRRRRPAHLAARGRRLRELHGL